MAIDRNKLLTLANTRGKQFLPLYAAASQKHGVPLGLLVAQGAQESGYWDPDVVSGKRNSSAGARGVGQFMPATAERFGIDPLDPAQAIDAQAKYMRQNYELLGNDWAKALAGYNWGEGNVQKKGLSNLPAETADYLRKILPYAGGASATAATPTRATVSAADYLPKEWLDKTPEAPATPKSQVSAADYLPKEWTADAREASKASMMTSEWFAKQAEREAAGLPVSADYLQQKGSGATQAAAGLGAGAGNVMGNVLELVDQGLRNLRGQQGGESLLGNAAKYFKQGASDLEGMYNQKSDLGMFDVGETVATLAPAFAAPVARAGSVPSLVNAATQGGIAYATSNEADRANNATMVGGLTAALPMVGKATRLAGSTAKYLGNATGEGAQALGTLSPKAAAARELALRAGSHLDDFKAAAALPRVTNVTQHIFDPRYGADAGAALMGLAGKSADELLIPQLAADNLYSLSRVGRAIAMAPSTALREPSGTLRAIVGDASGISAVERALAANTKAELSRAVKSPEHMAKLLDTLKLDKLPVNATAAERAAWVGAVNKGGKLQQTASALAKALELLGRGTESAGGWTVTQAPRIAATVGQ